jgi:hypothetical protein
LILPSKHAPLDKSILGIAAIVLRDLSGDLTVSQAWDAAASRGVATFDQFVTALDLLFVLNVVDHRDGRLVRP